MRIVFHAINGVGLGHLVRATAIAEEVRALHPDAAILMLTNARDTSMLTRAGLDFVSVPPALTEPHADPDRSRRSLPAPIEHAALAAALDTFKPDLVVFDTHAPLALARHATSIGARTVLVQRELRPAAFAAFLSSASSAAFDRIVVPHEPGEVDLRSAAHLPIVATGPVVRCLDTTLPPGITAPDVIVMAGGGGQPVDARRFLRAAADAHILARARLPRLSTLIVAGPYGQIPEQVRGIDGLEVATSCDHLPALMAHSRLVVSQAGYNSIAELRALAKPMVLVPGHRKAEDQSARAKRLVKMGAAVTARPDARSIADRIEALLCVPGALDAMVEAHHRQPLVAKNRAAAEAVLSPLRTPREVRRVVLVGHELAPRVGGMETVARALAENLFAKGVDVRVYTTRHFGPETLGLPPGSVRRIYPAGLDLWSDLLITLDALLLDGPDVIHLCNAGLGPWVPALAAAFPSAVTVNVHGNDLLAPWTYHGGGPAVYRAAQIAGLSAADAVHAVSQFSARAAETNGVDAARVHVIENGVDCGRFTPGDADSVLAERLGIAPDDEVVLTVSRLAPRKGHAVMLHALAQLLRARPKALYVYTGENARLSAELTELATALGVSERVRALGVVSETDLPAVYRLARVFALLSDEGPTDVEGFGVALLEAAASGLPVVATRAGGVPEAVADGSTGVLVAPGDVATTAAALGTLLGDPERARAMGERGRQRAEQRFSTGTRTGRVLDSWSAILRDKSGPRPLTGFATAFTGETSPDAGARTRSARASLAGATSGVALLRLAQQDAARRRAATLQRRQSFEKIVKDGGVVRLRAMDAGAALLVEALADCVALDHRPLVEMKLRRFLAADFQTHALPLIRGARLVHSVPADGAPLLLERIASLPDESFAKMESLSLFLSQKATASPTLAIDSVPEAYALLSLVSNRGVRTAPPAELKRYLSMTLAEGPRTGMIEPTNLCNLECPTCPTGKGKIPPKPQMTLESFDTIISALAPPLANLALWNYGEPLLNRELPSMIARAKEAGVRVVKVSSNAHFLNGERGRAVLESGLDVLILSIDGASEETYQVFRKGGDFASVARQVTWICAEKQRLGLKKPSIELQFIVMRHNEHELDEIRRLSVEWGVDKLRIKTVGAEDDSVRSLIPVNTLLSRYRADGKTATVRHAFCTMPWDHTVVNVDGSVTPCCYLRPDMGDAFIMGNIFSTPFEEIWNGERYRSLRREMLAGRASLPVCNKCRGGTQDLFVAIEEVGPR